MKTEAYFLYLFIIVYNRLEGLILNEFVCKQRREEGRYIGDKK